MANDRDISGVFNLKASFPSEEEKEAFFDAARKNDAGTLEKILRKFPGAALTWRDDSGAAVIPAAVSSLQPKTLALLLKAGANIDEGDTEGYGQGPALQTATSQGNLALMEMLLRAGAKVDIVGAYGQTPLMQAVEGGKLACADLLVLAGADPDFSGISYRKSALQRCGSQQMRDVIADAQKRRADFLAGKDPAAKPPFVPPAPPSARDMDPLLELRGGFPTDAEKEAFFEAARDNSVRGLRKTLEKFPDAALKWRNEDGVAVIPAAGAKLKPDTLEFLLSQGANIDDDGTPENKTWSALQWAAYNGNIERLALLLRFGAKIDLPNPYGETPLASAVGEDQKACVDLLVLAGADPALKGDRYRPSALEKCGTDEMRDIIKAAQEKRAYFIKGLPPAERPRFVPPPAPVVEPSTAKILKRIDLRFKI